MGSTLKARLRALERQVSTAGPLPVFTDTPGALDAEQRATVDRARAAGRLVIEVTQGHGVYDISGAEPVRMV